jgi:hypothetical protein
MNFSSNLQIVDLMFDSSNSNNKRVVRRGNSKILTMDKSTNLEIPKSEHKEAMKPAKYLPPRIDAELFQVEIPDFSEKNSMFIINFLHHFLQFSFQFIQFFPDTI